VRLRSPTSASTGTFPVHRYWRRLSSDGVYDVSCAVNKSTVPYQFGVRTQLKIYFANCTGAPKFGD
jgi:hypothetical protein